MGKVLYRKETIQKRDYIEKRLHGESTYMERKYTRKGDYTGRKLHGEVITWGRDSRGGNYTGKERHGGGSYMGRGLHREETTWGRELHGEGTAQREETKQVGDKKKNKKQRAYTQRGDMDGKETYTKIKPLIIQKGNYTNKRLCGKRIYR